MTKAIKATSRVPKKDLTFTIDFRKKKYSFTVEDNYAFGICPGSHVTVKNLKLTGSRMFDVGGHLIIEGGKADCGRIAWTNGSTNSKLEIKGGSFTQSYMKESFLQNRGTTQISKGTFYGGLENLGTMSLTGGTFSGGLTCTVYNDNGKEVTIKNATIKSANLRCIQNHGTCTIQSGTFTADRKVLESYAGSTTNILAGSFTNQNDAILILSGKAKISGGSFLGGTVVSRAKLTVSGGKFNEALRAEGGSSITIKKCTINQGEKPIHEGHAMLDADGGKITVKGGSFISPNGVGYSGNVVFKVSGDYKKLFHVKTLTTNQ
ncbi:MAG: hypothetical protein IIZ39_14290 [Blautia sp.]|nr:hypothetical protein [Blautia sp.]